MQEDGTIYRTDQAKDKTPEQIRKDEERLAKALQEDYDNIIGEQLEKLAAEADDKEGE